MVSQLSSSGPLPWAALVRLPHQHSTLSAGVVTQFNVSLALQFGLSNVMRNTEQMGRQGDAASSSAREVACSKFKIKPNCRCILYNMDASLSKET